MNTPVPVIHNLLPVLSTELLPTVQAVRHRGRVDHLDITGIAT